MSYVVIGNFEFVDVLEIRIFEDRNEVQAALIAACDTFDIALDDTEAINNHFKIIRGPVMLEEFRFVKEFYLQFDEDDSVDPTL